MRPETAARIFKVETGHDATITVLRHGTVTAALTERPGSKVARLAPSTNGLLLHTVVFVTLDPGVARRRELKEGGPSSAVAPG